MEPEWAGTDYCVDYGVQRHTIFVYADDEEKW